MATAMVTVGALATLWLLLLGLFASRLRAHWREPVMAAPVLIVESDDWGPGPATDGDWLERLRAMLSTHRDAAGRCPVVTLGVVLAAPAGPGVGSGSAARGYTAVLLDDGSQKGVLKAMQAGSAAGVFALQLHGHEHFWPPAVLKAAGYDAAARAFLSPPAAVVARHERLPPHLQSRWIDASALPSKPLSPAEIEAAVEAEVAAFQRVFGVPPRVAVPVTFVWTKAVEEAWSRHGIRVIVTPGVRNVGRDAGGRLVTDGEMLRNGDTTAGGLRCVVRDVYFEPALGHTAERALEATRERHRLGRPALLEMHRANFTAEPAQAERSLAELDRLLGGALAALPGLRFMSTQELAEALSAGDPSVVDRRLSARVRCFVRRAAMESRLRKLAWISGLAFVAAAAFAVASLLCAVTEGKVRRAVQHGTG